MDGGNTSALGKAMAVLEVLVRAPGALSLGEISRATGMARQTVHRLIQQLEGQALLCRDPGGDGYGAGPRLMNLGVEALAAGARTAPVRAVLTRLVAQIGETCNLGVLNRDQVVYVERVESDWPLRLQYGVGSRVPLHATAIGKLLWAYMAARERRRLLKLLPLPRLTENTITDRHALERELGEIRRQGYAANDQENVHGLIGLAVPMRDSRGRVVAGLAIHAAEARLPLERAVDKVRVLQAGARDLESLLLSDAFTETAIEPTPEFKAPPDLAVAPDP